MSKSVVKLVSSKDHNKRKSDLPPGSRISLADFIRENTAQIVSEWENFARTLISVSNDKTPLALRDHIQPMLKFIIGDIESPQTDLEQIKKSQGRKDKASTPTAAESHAALRLAGGFDIDQMVSEYRALRASVIKLWSMTNTELTAADLIDLTRFNESIDQELAESVSHYTQKVNYSKDLVFGILSHDLRTPIGAISMSAQLLLKIGTLSERQTMLASQIDDCTIRVTQIVDDLLDVTRARFGSGLPINKAPMDMGFVSRQLVDEMRAAYPTRTFNLEVSGDVKGEWDKARIGQVFSNLIGNAIQYSFKETTIGITVIGTSEAVLLSVHNQGVPIPPEKIGNIFDSLARAVAHEGQQAGTFNLGLGLYITKDIVVSHGGTIDVTSSEEGGTTFIARFPKSVSD
jgi:signal transduction histidine kinase